MDQINILVVDDEKEIADLVEIYLVSDGYKVFKANNAMEGLEILDIYTEQGKDRLLGNVVVKSELCEMPVVGFENHGGRTQINQHKPFGKVLHGAGNDGQSGAEGVVYKNVIGTYLHGPLLPKNPQLADWLIARALEKKYGETAELTVLDDTQEKEANAYVCNRFLK